jgi:uncharacterized protein with GYD domain
MMTFIVQANYTASAVKGLIGGAKGRRAVISGLIEAAGGKMKEMYMTTGDHDVMVIAEAPNAEAVLAVNMAIAASGAAAGLKTIRAFSPEEFEKIAQTAGKISGAYKAPGA